MKHIQCWVVGWLDDSSPPKMSLLVTVHLAPMKAAARVAAMLLASLKSDGRVIGFGEMKECDHKIEVGALVTLSEHPRPGTKTWGEVFGDEKYS
jgi:hypothetical protein